MGVKEQAVGHLESLWPDGGASVLAQARLPPWPRFLASVPASVLQVPPGPMPPGETLLGRLRDLHSRVGNHDLSIHLGRALLERRLATLGPKHPETFVAQGKLGAALMRAGRFDEASDPIHRAFRGLKSTLNRADLKIASAAADLANFLFRIGDLQGAARALTEAYELRKLIAPQTIGLVAAQLGEVQLELGNDEVAVGLLQEAWESLCQQRGEHHRVTLDRARMLATLQLRLDLQVRAVPVLRSLHAWATEHGDENEVARVEFQLGRALDATGKKEESYRLTERSMRWTRAYKDPETGLPHPDLPHRLGVWSRMAELRGRPHEAEGYLLEAVEVEKLIFGEVSPEVGLRQASIGDLAYRMRRMDDAIGWLESAVALLRSTLDDDHEVVIAVVETLIDLLLEKADQCFEELKAPDMGWQYIGRGRQLCHQVLGTEHPSHKTLKYYRS